MRNVESMCSMWFSTNQTGWFQDCLKCRKFQKVGDTVAPNIKHHLLVIDVQVMKRETVVQTTAMKMMMMMMIAMCSGVQSHVTAMYVQSAVMACH